MNADYNTGMLDAFDRRTAGWLLVGLGVWALTAPVLSAVAGRSLAALATTVLWIIVPLVYAVVARDAPGVGLTLGNVRPALLDTLVLTAFYCVLRLGVIALAPAVAKDVAGGPLEVAEALRTVEFGTWRGPRPMTFVLTFAVALATALAVELFYRGFLFTRIQRATHWIVAVLASALLFGGYHYFAGGPVPAASAVALSLVSGWLMARHGTLIAPILFHYLQYVAAVLVFYFLP